MGYHRVNMEQIFVKHVYILVSLPRQKFNELKLIG